NARAMRRAGGACAARETDRDELRERGATDRDERPRERDPADDPRDRERWDASEPRPTFERGRRARREEEGREQPDADEQAHRPLPLLEPRGTDGARESRSHEFGRRHPDERG